MSTIREQGDLLRMFTHQIHDNLVAFSRIWSRREELRHTETDPMCKIHDSRCTSRFARNDFAQVNLISVTPMLQNLRMGLRRRQSGKSKVPVKQRGSWPKVY